MPGKEIRVRPVFRLDMNDKIVMWCSCEVHSDVI
jgi:hypothetical protein